MDHDYVGKGLFALLAAFMFLAFSPLDAPGGMVVAVGGGLIGVIAAIVFFCLNWIEKNRVD